MSYAAVVKLIGDENFSRKTAKIVANPKKGTTKTVGGNSTPRNQSKPSIRTKPQPKQQTIQPVDDIFSTPHDDLSDGDLAVADAEADPCYKRSAEQPSFCFCDGGSWVLLRVRPRRQLHHHANTGNHRPRIARRTVLAQFSESQNACSHSRTEPSTRFCRQEYGGRCYRSSLSRAPRQYVGRSLLLYVHFGTRPFNA